MNWLKRQMNTTTLIVFCSLPPMTSEMNLWVPWTISGLQPLGSFRNLSKHELFGKESWEILIFTKKNRWWPETREVITTTFIEVRSGFVSVSDPPGDDTPGPWVTIIYHETVLINHGDSTHVTTWSRRVHQVRRDLESECCHYNHCIGTFLIRIHVSTPSVTERHRLQITFSHEGKMINNWLILNFMLI